MKPEPDAYFVELGGGHYQATAHTSGAWSEAEQHISPMVGLCIHEIELRLPSPLQVSRIGVDIFGTVPVADFTIEVSVVRPGRTVELVEAVVGHAGRTVMVARVWRLAPADTTAVAGGWGSAPGEFPPWDITSVWPGGYIASLDVRRSPAAVPGRATAWITSPLALVVDRESSTLARYTMLLDTANGICVRQGPRRWMFPNLDLTIHLHRQPIADRVGLETTVTFGATGLGLTHSVLHDDAGPLGRASQSLTVRPLPGAD
ncbi:MAG TPA: thioesterase family protein [Nocardioides sp.]|uniref:thioesterase family protein n=1 Tax=uncultured Nocardioides sp. TaxID=198441 RepID=UPI000EBE8132|nr:thioesterase family protein [uncultured Nocardioides sp.]HCB03618.1 thioesterase [Nocardioides sp.]HRD60828.1 thioesterase family protein [Nocardioides sp.]HRI96911.1 thioesterase family protein [Nocardioides sp.]HRK45035.1 thioesterase family protein [Nocardioides sp.]